MRIIHRIIATNIVLNKMGVTANTQCGFCNDEKDSTEFFVCLKCACIQRFWNLLEIMLKEKCDSAKCKIYTKPCIVWNRNRHEN